jgi:CheY-like chemotaxis protein
MARVLVLDDDPLIQATLPLLLREHGHEVLTATNGKLGLRLLQTERVDLILTDILMPEADGIEVVRAVVKDHPTIALVAMSGGSSRLPGTDAVQLTRLLGAHAVLVKPFGEAELVEAIRMALEKVRPAR